MEDEDATQASEGTGTDSRAKRAKRINYAVLHEHGLSPSSSPPPSPPESETSCPALIVSAHTGAEVPESPGDVLQLQQIRGQGRGRGSACSAGHGEGKSEGSSRGRGRSRQGQPRGQGRGRGRGRGAGQGEAQFIHGFQTQVLGLGGIGFQAQPSHPRSSDLHLPTCATLDIGDVAIVKDRVGCGPIEVQHSQPHVSLAASVGSVGEANLNYRIDTNDPRVVDTGEMPPLKTGNSGRNSHLSKNISSLTAFARVEPIQNNGGRFSCTEVQPPSIVMSDLPSGNASARKMYAAARKKSASKAGGRSLTDSQVLIHSPTSRGVPEINIGTMPQGAEKQKGRVQKTGVARGQGPSKQCKVSSSGVPAQPSMSAVSASHHLLPPPPLASESRDHEVLNALGGGRQDDKLHRGSDEARHEATVMFGGGVAEGNTSGLSSNFTEQLCNQQSSNLSQIVRETEINSPKMRGKLGCRKRQRATKDVEEKNGSKDSAETQSLSVAVQGEIVKHRGPYKGRKLQKSSKKQFPDASYVADRVAPVDGVHGDGRPAGQQGIQSAVQDENSCRALVAINRDPADAQATLNQRSPAHREWSLAVASDGADGNIQFSPEWHRFSDTVARAAAYRDVEFIGEWQSYCPYASLSPKLRQINVDGKSQVSALPLFGSSRVTPCTDNRLVDYYDLVINAGGPLWALDWCPERQGWQFKQGCKKSYLAIGVHPYDSQVHRLGEPVYGKGIIQIWAFTAPPSNLSQPDKPDLPKGQGKGKPKKRAPSRGKLGGNSTIGNSNQADGTTEVTYAKALESGRSSSNPSEAVPALGELKLICTAPEHDLAQDESMLSFEAEVDCHGLSSTVAAREVCDLPEMVMGLAHNGGVCWDAKWQPSNGSMVSDSRELFRLGYLAVLLGDGAIQVFDVPLPGILKDLETYKSCTVVSSPVIVKLNPVFRCSGLSVGNGQKSMPLTLEWSSLPHDMIVVGCHDGVVALWKFIPNQSSDQDIRPLMCFVADSAPIRGIAWADGSETESANVLVTAGHSGSFKVWDLRDPFYPLWDQAVSKGGCILSIQWISNPDCLVFSLDDGSIRILNLDLARSDFPVTGKPCTKSLTHGFYSFFVSSFAIWTAQYSLATGILLYGGEAGAVVQFHLTEKSISTDRRRSKSPHYVCAQFMEESDSGILSLMCENSVCPVQLRRETCKIPLANVLETTSSFSVEDEMGVKTKTRKPSAKNGISEVSPTVDDSTESLALVPYDPQSRENSTPGASNDCMRNNRHAVGGQLESMPSKQVSVHRIRWNQNKGLENWVSFGGAAGIVRCQLIFPRA